MPNLNHIHNSPYSHDEARIFVRHSDGSSLVVPEQANDIDQLSFRMQIPFGLSIDKRLTAINEVIKDDEENGLGFIALQRFLGGAESAVSNGSGVHDFAYGYLGQIHIGKSAGEGTGRQIMPITEARDIINNSPLIDSIDRKLAFQAFRTAEISSYLDLAS